LKRIFGGLLILCMFLALTGCSGGQKTENSEQSAGKQVQLGIIQIVEHPALDAARQGFLDTLAKNGYEGYVKTA